ncbi:hypothetical protein JCM11251_006789 [Rhodosporidiobolus azoricus]
MAVGTYLHRREAAVGPEEHTTSFMTDQELFVALLLLLSVFFPPIAVFLERGCGLSFVLNLLLTCLGFLPGLLHALYLSEEAIHYNSSSYASPPPSKGSLTLDEVLRAASDEEREEKARLEEKRGRSGRLPSSPPYDDTLCGSDLDKGDAALEQAETGLTRPPTYRSTATGPPRYGDERLKDEDEKTRESSQEGHWAEVAGWSEKKRGKRREQDSSKWV